MFVLLLFKGIETMNNDCTWVFNFQCVSNFQYESLKRVHPFVITSFCEYIFVTACIFQPKNKHFILKLICLKWLVSFLSTSVIKF